jgi:7-cyano-7-deazaguanine synthase
VKAAILLSGGIDSTAVAFWKRPALAITVDYGQAASDAEIYSASIIAAKLQIPHRVIRTDLRDLGVGTMANGKQLPISPTPEWWPFRNQLLITLGAMIAIKENCSEVLIGTVSSDNLHADGSPKFLKHIDQLIGAQEGQLHVCAPAAEIKTEDLVARAKITPALLAWCHSCHRGSFACGQCRGCQKSRAVRNALGLVT